MTQQIIPLIDQCGQCCTKILSFNLHTPPLKAVNTHHWNIFLSEAAAVRVICCIKSCIIPSYLFWLLITRGLSGTLEIRFTATFHICHSAPHFLPSCWPYVTKIGAAELSVQILSQKLPKSMSFKKQD